MATPWRIRERVRKRTITDERPELAPALMGRRLAGYWPRIFAFYLDVISSGLLAIPWNYALLAWLQTRHPSIFEQVADSPFLVLDKEIFLARRAGENVDIALHFGELTGNFFCLAPYLILLPWITNGWTPWKWIFGIRILRLDGRRLRFGDLFERYAGLAVGVLTLGVGFLQILWDKNRQAAHDKLAHTVVARAPRRRPRAKPDAGEA
ncbi:MAG: RDD family protein [Candidatus Krumholzibacteriota bacterium]|nr:RDD family protein [Candidatus Krumholzibacteriota bacterium]